MDSLAPHPPRPSALPEELSSLFYRWQSGRKKLAHVCLPNKQQCQGLGPGSCVNHYTVPMCDSHRFPSFRSCFALHCLQKKTNSSAQHARPFKLSPPPALSNLISYLTSFRLWPQWDSHSPFLPGSLMVPQLCYMRCTLPIWFFLPTSHSWPGNA